ncbi:MAG: tetratricopeptide repeat protein [Actinophytocola sp.]|uniref:tetratricopeptide repeat protein n=1 Tax=Actinophytocola sp. TaxID=1872138 RepID=UPI003C730316
MRVVRGRWEWLAAAVLAVAGVASAAVGALGLGHWTWLVVTAVAVAAVAKVPSAVMTKRVQTRAERSAEQRRQLADGAVGGGRGRVRDVGDDDLTRVGVHPAVLPDDMAEVAPAGSSGRMPPYVRRDQHEEVARRLTTGAFVVIQGHSGAGKSRLGMEVLRAELSDHRLFAPDPAVVGAAVDQMRQVRSAVLWLDDLDRFLEADVLTATLIGELLQGSGHHRVVVATLRHQAREAMLTATDPTSTVVDRRHRVLEAGDTVRIAREFTTTELDRANDLAGDPRIRDALAHADTYGLAEYLAAGPQLLHEWETGKDIHPRGSALIAAAVDCRRAGYIAPLPRALLNTVHDHYLATRSRGEVEDLDTAWTWATALWRHTTAMLEPANTDTVIVFDYLVDHIQRTTPVDNDPPEHTITTALSFADATTANAIGNHATQRGRYHLALTAHQHALTYHTDPHHPETLTSRNNLATTLTELGRFEEAEREHRAVLDLSIRVLGADHPDTLISRNNLAYALTGLGRFEEAEREHRAVLDLRTQALGAEHPDTLNSRNNLAYALTDLGRFEEAEREHRAVLDLRAQALGAEHPDTLNSRNNLAYALMGLGRFEEAEREHRAVLDLRTQVLGANHPDTLTSRSNLAYVRSKLE